MTEIENFIINFNENVNINENTMLQKIGISHDEVKINNLLAFYLNPSEIHGLKDAVLIALLESANIKPKYKLNNFIVEKPNYFKTDNGKEIDICMYNTEFALIVENKIFANLDNPFEDYVRTINSININNYKILLYLKNYKKDELQRATKNGFILVHYENFIKNVRKIKINKENKWQVLFLDFIDTLEGLYSTIKLPIESIKWIKDNSNNISKYYKIIKNKNDEIYSKYNIILNSLVYDMNKKADIINQKNIDTFGLTRNLKRLHFDEKNLYIFSIMDIYVNGVRIAIDNAIGINNICINLNIVSSSKNILDYKNNIIKKLEKGGFNINKNPQNPYTNESHINLYDLNIDTPLDDIIEINKRIIVALNK